MAPCNAAPDGIPIRTKKARRRISPALLRRKDAAAYLGVGGSTLDRLNAGGLVPAPIKLAGSVCWCRAELAAWCRHGCPLRTEWQPKWQAIVTARSAVRK